MTMFCRIRSHLGRGPELNHVPLSTTKISEPPKTKNPKVTLWGKKSNRMTFDGSLTMTFVGSLTIENREYMRILDPPKTSAWLDMPDKSGLSSS